jgi:hypothetical protein
MNPSIFVSVAKEPGLSTSERESIRYDIFVQKLLKPLPENLSVCHIAMGLAGELGELFADNCDELEEFGDYEFYLQAALNHYNLTHNHIYPTNFIAGIDDYEFVYWTGQLIDCIKREYIYNKSRELDRIKECLSMITCYLTDQYFGMETSKQEILQANAEKLEKRYAGLYYSDEAAQARADKN